MDEDHDESALAEFERQVREDPRLRLRLASHHVDRPFSQAKLEAAENLLVKAKTALLRSDS